MRTESKSTSQPAQTVPSAPGVEGPPPPAFLSGPVLLPTAHFTISLLRYLDPDGSPTQELPPLARDPVALRQIYRALVFSRLFDQKAVALQRTGQLGTYASMLGQEAIGVALGSALRPDDVLLPSYRDAGAMFWRGVRPSKILSYWRGDERSMDFEGACPRDFPITVTIGAHCTHAVGVAYALKLRGEGQAAVCSLGDGATSKGDFYEGLNAAGVWRLPLVFLVSNNGYAISASNESQTAAATFAQKGLAGGLACLQVDGNDIFALRHALDEALDHARQDRGPCLIEAVTYRLHDHTTADDASRYRTKAEVDAAWTREPIRRFRAWLEAAGLWSREEEETILTDCRREVQATVDEYLAEEPPLPHELLFSHLYAELPAAFQAQREIARRLSPRSSH